MRKKNPFKFVGLPHKEIPLALKEVVMDKVGIMSLQNNASMCATTASAEEKSTDNNKKTVQPKS